MKAFVVITVARQINGEYVFVRPEGGSLHASKADSLRSALAAKYAGPDGKPLAVKLTTPQGEAECYCEVGGFEMEIEE